MGYRQSNTERKLNEFLAGTALAIALHFRACIFTSCLLKAYMTSANLHWQLMIFWIQVRRASMLIYGTTQPTVIIQHRSRLLSRGCHAI
jgi:hypothetical protein